MKNSVLHQRNQESIQRDVRGLIFQVAHVILQVSHCLAHQSCCPLLPLALKGLRILQIQIPKLFFDVNAAMRAEQWNQWGQSSEIHGSLLLVTQGLLLPRPTASTLLKTFSFGCTSEESYISKYLAIPFSLNRTRPFQYNLTVMEVRTKYAECILLIRTSVTGLKDIKEALQSLFFFFFSGTNISI